MSEEADFDQLQQALDAMIAGLSPQRRRGATRAIAIELRRSQAQRIAAQLNPDGTPFEPRKPRRAGHRADIGARADARHRGGVRQRAMFAKLRTTRFLKARSDADGVEVGFSGRAGQIARVHQEGLRDRVDPRRSTAEAQYPARRLLGLAADDRQRLLDTLVNLLGS